MSAQAANARPAPDPELAAALLALFGDPARLEATPVNELVDLTVI